MVFLGWNPKNNREIFSLEELVPEFSLERLNKSGAVFNLEKLNNINGYYIRQMKSKDLIQMILQGKFLKYNLKSYSQSYIEKAINTIQERLKKLNEVQEFTRFYFQKPDYNPELLIWKNTESEEIKRNLEIGEKVLNNLKDQDYKAEILEKVLRKLITEKKIGTGELLWPLRVALTGEAASPGPFEVAEVLGKDEVLVRVEMAIEKL